MYDSIIIGSGPAGITSAIYMKRAGMNVLIISKKNSSLLKTNQIENYYGFEKIISGEELYKAGINQAKNLEIDIIDREVINVKYCDDGFEIIVANQGIDESYTAKFIVFATGANRNTPNITGIKEFEGKGVSYCAVCDAMFYKNKEVAVLGNGEYAIGEVEELLPIAKKVTILTNGKKMVEKRLDIEVEENSISRFSGNNKIEQVEFENGSSKKIEGLFVAQGVASSMDFARKIGAKIDNNCICVNNNMETTVNNVYACGDCTGGILQISKAVYEGMVAGLEIIKKHRLK